MSEIKQKGPDEVYCPSCGEVIKKEAVLCVHCGVLQKATKSAWSINSRWLTSLLFCIFLGAFGIHRFYNRKIAPGVITLLIGFSGFLGFSVTAIRFIGGIGNIAGYNFMSTYSSEICNIAQYGFPAILAMVLWSAIAIWQIIDIMLLVAGRYAGPEKTPITMRDKNT